MIVYLGAGFIFTVSKEIVVFLTEHFLKLAKLRFYGEIYLS